MHTTAQTGNQNRGLSTSLDLIHVGNTVGIQHSLQYCKGNGILLEAWFLNFRDDTSDALSNSYHLVRGSRVVL